MVPTCSVKKFPLTFGNISSLEVPGVKGYPSNGVFEIFPKNIDKVILKISISLRTFLKILILLNNMTM